MTTQCPTQVYQGKRELIPSRAALAEQKAASISGKTRIDPQHAVQVAGVDVKYIRENEN